MTFEQFIRKYIQDHRFYDYLVAVFPNLRPKLLTFKINPKCPCVNNIILFLKNKYQENNSLFNPLINNHKDILEDFNKLD
jgi:hypothetical protein